MGRRPDLTPEEAEDVRQAYGDRSAKWTTAALAYVFHVSITTIQAVIAERGAYKRKPTKPGDVKMSDASLPACPGCGQVEYACNCGERLDAIAQALGLQGGLEAITVEPNDGAPDGYEYGAWVGEFELGCTVGTGRTPNEAIEDLLDQLRAYE